ncbi:unnamed protein product, partial [Mesorhabditis spiculigera]
MRNFITILVVTLVAAIFAFDQLPSNYSLKQRKTTCKDYCMGKFISDQTDFHFQDAGWEICACPVAQESGSWFNSKCYKNCHKRCLSTNGLCAWNQALNTDYKGRCCSNANNNAAIRKQCYKNGTGLCYQT